MCFCLSGCMVNWWTNRSPLAFSFTALYPVFLRQGSNCLLDSLYAFCFWLNDRVEYGLNLFAFSLNNFLFLLLGFFFFRNHTPLPHIFLYLCVWLLGYALLTHCDSSALRTPCLPADDHMLPQHCSGKLSLYSINFMMLVCSSQQRLCQPGQLETYRYLKWV